MEKPNYNEFRFFDDENIKKEMKKAYSECLGAVKYISELGLSEEEIDNNIYKIYDFVCDINYCKNCPGLAKCKKDNSPLCTKIIYKGGIVDRELVPCKEILKQMSFEAQFIYQDFPDQYLNLSLKDIDETKERKLILSKYVQFIKENNQQWVYVTGGVNSGRTFVTSLLCVDAAKKKKGPIAFINSSKRLRELNDMSFSDKERFQKELERLSNVPILVFDDFGNEFKTDFIRDAIILQILSGRAQKKLVTIFTSDFSINDIVALYSTSKAGEIRARQLGKIITTYCGKEINLGDLAIY